MVINPHHTPKHKLPYVELRGHRRLPDMLFLDVSPDEELQVSLGVPILTLTF